MKLDAPQARFVGGAIGFLLGGIRRAIARCPPWAKWRVLLRPGPPGCPTILKSSPSPGAVTSVERPGASFREHEKEFLATFPTVPDHARVTVSGLLSAAPRRSGTAR